MNVFVTGGAGYIGSITAAELLRAGHDVIVYDNLSTGHRRAIPKGAQFIRGDIGQARKLRRILNEEHPDAVMHFCAVSLVGESMENPAKYFENNVAKTLNLLQAMMEADVNRIVFSSTAAVYGMPDQIPITENADVQPVNPYGDSKVMIERMLHWFDEAYGMRYAALRYFNAAGAGHGLGEHHEPETHLIPIVLQVALGQREKIQIYGTNYSTPDGTAVRDYIHVLDLASAHILALESLERRSGIYNLGNGQGFSVKQVIDIAHDVTGHPIPTEAAHRRPGDPPVLIASSAKIQRELGWRPKHPSLHDIIYDAWEWHQAHPDGYEK